MNELNLKVLTEITELDMPQHVKPTLFYVIDEGDEAHGAARVGNHQKDLGPPELDVVLPDVEHQKILTDLQAEQRRVRNFNCGNCFMSITDK